MLTDRKTQVPLSAPSSAAVDVALPRATGSMLPGSHLTPQTLLGGGGEDRELVGKMYAAQIARHLEIRNPEDRRTLLVGLGLVKFDTAREALLDLLELVQKLL